MQIHLGFRDSNPIQQYASDILAMTPSKRKADLVARAIYAYFGGKPVTENELSIMLTGKLTDAPLGKPSKTPRKITPTNASHTKKRTKQEENRQTVKDAPLYNKDETQQGAPEPEIIQDIPDNTVQVTDNSDYQFTAEDNKMVQDVMAAFRAMG